MINNEELRGLLKGHHQGRF